MQHTIGFEIEQYIELRHPFVFKMTKTCSTAPEETDQPDLLRTINLAAPLHSGTAAPLYIIKVGVVRLMM